MKQIRTKIKISKLQRKESRRKPLIIGILPDGTKGKVVAFNGKQALVQTALRNIWIEAIHLTIKTT
jgi:hypothetical protein